MFSVLAYASTIKWIVPGSILLGSAPNFFFLWLTWRAITLMLPRKVYVAGDDFLYSLYQRLVLYFFEHGTGVEVHFYGDAVNSFQSKENVILLSNHQCSVDWIIANMLGVRQNSIGHIKYILKEELKWLPLYGMYFKQHGCIYVNRSGKFEQSKAEKQLQNLRDSDNPFWIVIFPEGTRYNPQKKSAIEKSEVFAKNKGFAPLETHLTPRTKALSMALNHLHTRMDAVYDVTIAYKNKETGDSVTAPSLAEFLCGRCSEVHIHVTRIPVASVPRDDDHLFSWLYGRFQHKDSLMRRFRGPDRSLGDAATPHQLPLSDTVPAFLLFAGLGSLCIFTAAGRSFYLQASLACSALCLVWAAARSG